MSLLRRPLANQGMIHNVTPASAGWHYVGFSLHILSPGETLDAGTGDNEVIIVLLEGIADISVGDRRFGEIGDRKNVFERSLPYSVYAPAGSAWQARAATRCALAACSAPGAETGRGPMVIGPDQVEVSERGLGSNRRLIHNIAMESQDFADRLLVTEVYTPHGHWSSYPPHRHDEDDFPQITYLEETYYHRMNPPQGFGFQRVFTDDGSIDETLCVHDHDVVLVPKGYHPCGAPFGYEMYYLNVMAGPLRRWRFKDHPDHAWLHAYSPED